MDKSWINLFQSFSTYYEYFLERLPAILTGIVFLFIFHFLAKYVVKIVRKAVEMKIEDKLVLSFVIKLTRIVLLGIAILLFLRIIGLGQLALGIWGTAGIGAFILGFAFKDIGEHFLAGFILALKRPFRVGDIIEINGYTGTVLGLDLRDTHIKTFDGKDVYIPNGILIKNVLLNYTIDGYIRNDISIDVKAESDVDQSIQIIDDVIKNHSSILQDVKTPFAMIDQISNGRVTLKAFYWLDLSQPEISSLSIKQEVTSKILRDMKQYGVDITSSFVQ